MSNPKGEQGKHTGPPMIGTTWETTEERRTITNVQRMGGVQYLVFYVVSRGYPEWRTVGRAHCSGTEWKRWTERARRAGT